MARWRPGRESERGITVVLIEHDMGVVMDISDTVVVLDRGRRIARRTPRRFSAIPRSSRPISHRQEGGQP